MVWEATGQNECGDVGPGAVRPLCRALKITAKALIGTLREVGGLQGLEQRSHLL